MPAKVNEAFARSVCALFKTDGTDTVNKESTGNIFFQWNTLAAKFPTIYDFASATRNIRTKEEKLMLFFKRDPRSAEDRKWFAAKFMDRIENETARTLGGALDNWWKEISQ